MKTLKIALVSAMIALSTSAFAENSETCAACEAQKAYEATSTLSADSATLSDSGVKGILHNMTLRVQEKVNNDDVNSILQNMTQKVRESVKKNSEASNTF